MNRPPQPSASARAGRATAANRGRDTRLELAVRSRVHARGLRYFVGRRPMPGLRRTADLLFPRVRVVVLLDGCYWHGCPEHFRMPTANPGYWPAKIARNVARDRETDEKLTEAGWRVLRFWEHEDPDDIACEIERAVRQA
ncbi:very short patch repair endonuclease [Blastococcus saxobsidens]|uniref:T/G mismatch-specific endonuclease n=1 Tax=Blastococcus saxobsidens TaxID=138336 RepID=A0A4Q7Y2Z6_9ACTN|nr:very short patch repair endonuclease [Blastococcus saxobsidens]RZU30888.1 T/G mismatch-specific endonuclease [Blastococcus saxobsidens]